MSELKVGDRVSYNGTLDGTLEFFGTTNFSTGIWCGVSLDLPKGKNDGSVAGKSYFKCEPNHGIFVRSSQLTKLDLNSDSQDSKSKPSGLKRPTQIKNRNIININKQEILFQSENRASIEFTEIVARDNESFDKQSPAVEVNQPVSTENGSDNLNTQIKDLNEKLQTLQIKRNEDKEKLREYEKIKILVQQLEENKKQLQEKAAEYQRSHDKSKQDFAKLNEEFENYREETASLSDNIEMITIDKEMAEEKLDALRSEIDLLKGKNEELTLENEILKLEQKGGSGGTIDEAQFSMIKVQNNKLRDAIILMRDLNENQKNENEKLCKEVSKHQMEIDKITKERDRLSFELKEARESIIELKEQVDSSLGADEMVSNLADQNLAFEEKVRSLEDAKLELEELCDMNNEINENNVVIINDMKNELSNKDLAIRELNTVLVAKNECIMDYEGTIDKFRDLVRDLQTQIKELKNQEMRLTSNQDETIKASEVYKAKVSETKSLITVIDNELQKLELKHFSNQVNILQKFLPDKFFKSGGDNDSILMILLVDKLIYKVELLIKQIKDEFLATSESTRMKITKDSPESVIQYHKLIFLLNTWYIILRHYKQTLSTCQLTTFNRFGALFGEMNPNEKSIDYFIELLKKGQLNENSSMEPLERSINYFKTFYRVHLVNEQHDVFTKINDFIRLLLSGSDSLSCCCKQLVTFLEGHKVENIEILEFISQFQEFSNKLTTYSKNMRKNLGNNVSLRINSEVSTSLDKCVTDITSLVKILSGYCLEVMSMCEEDEVKDISLSIAYKFIEKFMELRNISSVQPVLKSTESIIKVISHVADSVEHGEYDFEGAATKIEEPIATISNNFKNDLSNLESTSFKLEQKDDELRQLKLNFKLKCEELSEMSVRLNVAEKKLSTCVKEKEESISRLEQKLEQTKTALSRKERELDQTSEALQADINQLENQREELKKQLKDTKKRSFFENTNVVPAKLAEQIEGSNNEFMGLINEIQTLRTIVSNLRHENFRLKCVKAKKDILSIQPLSIPRKEIDTHNQPSDVSSRICEIEAAVSHSEKLAQEVYSHMSSVKVVDLSKAQAESTFMKEKTYTLNLKSNLNKFKRSKGTLLAEERLFSQLWSDMDGRGKDPSLSVGRISIGLCADRAGDTIVPASDATVARIRDIFCY